MDLKAGSTPLSAAVARGGVPMLDPKNYFVFRDAMLKQSLKEHAAVGRLFADDAIPEESEPQVRKGLENVTVKR
jgi:hypothetical protein